MSIIPCEQPDCNHQVVNAAGLRDETRKLKEAVSNCYPDLWPLLEAALAVTAIGLMRDNAKCTALIFVGPPSVGKTTPLMWLAGSRDERFYRSDKFTPASFVSHQANQKKGNLQEKDLLPRIKGKVLLTPEMATYFHGKREELEERFSILARVLDGQGLMTDSGAQGRRGYSGDCKFDWLGATTPLSSMAIEMMGQVGPRLVFYEMTRPRPSVEDLSQALHNPNSAKMDEQCTRAVAHYLTAMRSYYAEGVSSHDVEFPSGMDDKLAALAEILTRLRAPATGVQEYPDRVLWILRNLAVGRALVWGRRQVNYKDIAFVRHVVFSSSATSRGKVLKALAELGGKANLQELASQTGLHEDTVRTHAKELDTVFGLVSVQEGGGRTVTTTVRIRDEWIVALCS